MLHETLSRTGIEVAGDLSWGSHICLFYETAQDLIEANAGYFRAGLEDGDFCLWAVSDPLSREAALEGLRERIPNIDAHVAAGRMELMPGYGWYLRGKTFDPHRITGYWLAKLAELKTRGCSGLRASGNAFWLETDLWRAFLEYEADINDAFANQKVIALCTYPLNGSSSTDLLEVARLHKSCITRREGRWELLETLESLRNHDQRSAGPVNGSPQDLMTSFAGHGLLTPKERVVLWQLLKGASAKESARLLGISPRTVEFHRGNIMRKLGARTTAELFARLFVGEEARLHGAA